MRILALFLAFASTLLLPALALAQSVITGENLPPTTLSIDGCAAAYGMPVQDWYLTTLVVFCIKETIKAATVAFITLVLTALRDTIAVLFCLAVVFYGIRVMMQDQDLPRMSFGFLMRLTIVVGVSFNLPTFVAWPFEILEDMLVMGTGGWSPWLQIDNAVGQLLGFGPGRSLFQGVLGLIGAALYTSATGMFMFLFGFLIIFSLLGRVYRARADRLPDVCLAAHCPACCFRLRRTLPAQVA